MWSYSWSIHHQFVRHCCRPHTVSRPLQCVSGKRWPVWRVLSCRWSCWRPGRRKEVPSRLSSHCPVTGVSATIGLKPILFLCLPGIVFSDRLPERPPLCSAASGRSWTEASPCCCVRWPQTLPWSTRRWQTAWWRPTRPQEPSRTWREGRTGRDGSRSEQPLVDGGDTEAWGTSGRIQPVESTVMVPRLLLMENRGNWEFFSHELNNPAEMRRVKCLEAGSWPQSGFFSQNLSVQTCKPRLDWTFYNQVHLPIHLTIQYQMHLVPKCSCRKSTETQEEHVKVAATVCPLYLL